MAGDWIQMRVSLAKDPKVIAIADHLAVRPEFLTWLSCERVTRNVTVSVTVAALLLVWGVANERGKVSGEDLLLHHSTISSIDEIAGVPGFGSAMAYVEWAIQESNGGGKPMIRFPEFLTHNIPTETRPRSANAERQRRYRERHRDVTRNAEVTLQSNAKEQDSTEQLLLTPHSPPVPKKLNGNGAAHARKKPATRAPDAFEITEPMWAWATEQGVIHERIENETAKFLDHHKAKGSLFSDWPAAWRKWMRNVVDFAARAH